MQGKGFGVTMGSHLEDHTDVKCGSISCCFRSVTCLFQGELMSGGWGETLLIGEGSDPVMSDSGMFCCGALCGGHHHLE